MTLNAPSKDSRWDDMLGPFYSTQQVEKLFGGVSALSLKTSDKKTIYPAFQFDEQNRVVSGLSEVLLSFRDSGVDDWTLAGWLVSPSGSLDGRSVVEWLRQGRELEPALALARDAAQRFSR